MPSPAGARRASATTDADPAQPGAPGIWQLAWPAITANLLASLVGIVDMKIVGALGAGAVAAVTTGNRIFFILQALLMAVTAGTTALVARAWGAGDQAEAGRVARASLWLCMGVALAMTAIALAAPHRLAGVFRVDPEAIDLAATFIRCHAPFQIAFGVYFALGAALRAAGDTRTPLWIGALTNVVNVALAIVLVYAPSPRRSRADACAGSWTSATRPASSSSSGRAASSRSCGSCRSTGRGPTPPTASA
jgi:Na+-driven multidrug efflux pump